MNERLDQILSSLAALRRKTLFTRTALAFALFGLGMFAILIAFSVTSRTGHGSAALGIVFWIYLAGALFATGFLLKRKWLDQEKTALLCQDQFPELGDGLISLVQLGNTLRKGKPDFSLTLFERHLAQVEDKLCGIDLDDASGAERLKIPVTLFAGTALIWLVLLISLPGYSNSLIQALSLRALRPGKTAGVVKVSRPLELYDFSIAYQYPAYTGLPAKRVDGGDGSISAMKGTVAALRAKVPVKVEKAWLQFSSGGKMEVTLKGSELSARMILLDSGRYRVQALDQDGKQWTEPVFHQINAAADNLPEVALIEPASDFVASQEQEVRLKFRSRDDFGLEQTSLVFTSRGREKRIPVQEFSPPELEAEGEYGWRLSEQNLIPGEKVSYYIEARDNNHVTGPGIGKSQVRYLEVFSPLKNHQAVIAEEQKLFEALIAFLGQSIDAVTVKAAPAKYRENESGLIKGLADLKALADAVRKEADQDEYSTALIREALALASARYGKMTGERRRSFSAKDQNSTEAQRGKAVVEMERDVLFWDLQLKKQRMDYLLSLGKELKEAEAQLRKLIDEYKRTGNLDLLAEIEARLEELKAVYQEFLAGVAQLDQTQVDEFVNMDALARKGAGDVMQRLEQFRQSVHDRDMDNAMRDAEDFLNGLDEMLRDLEKGSESMGQAISEELMAQVEEGMNELKMLRQAEEKLIQVTDPIYQDLLKRQERMSASAQKIIDGLKPEMDRLEQNLREQTDLLNRTPLDYKDPQQAQKSMLAKNRISSSIWQLQQQVRNAKDLLESRDYEQAGREMRAVQNTLERGKTDFNRECAGSVPGKGAQAVNSSLDRNVNSAKAVADRISQMAGTQTEGLSQAQKDALERLSLEQGALKDRLIALEKKVGDLFKDLPAPPDKVPKQLSSAELKMRDAQGELELDNAELAVMAEKEAKHWLEQAEKALEQFKQKVMENSRSGSVADREGGGSRPGQGKDGGMGIKTQDFELPGRESNKDPVEMRKQILKAMREGSPKDYEELNRDYYKRLVQ